MTVELFPYWSGLLAGAEDLGAAPRRGGCRGRGSALQGQAGNRDGKDGENQP